MDFRDVAGGGDEGNGVVAEFLAEADFLCCSGDVDDVLAVEDALHFLEWVTGFLIGKDAGLLFCGDVAEAALHGEAIHLGLGEGVGAAELDGVLGGDDEEEVVKVVAGALDGDLALAHGFEEGGLGAWGGAVDFIGEEDVGEDGALVEFEFLGFRVEDGDAEDVGWEQVRGELDAFEGGSANGGCDGFGEGGFACARVVLQEDVAAGEEAGEDAADDGGLAVDDVADAGFEGFCKFGFSHGGGCIFRVAW